MPAANPGDFIGVSTVCRYMRKRDQLRCMVCGRRVAAGAPLPVDPCPAFRGRGLPGSELKVLLAGWPFFVQPTASCPCNDHAALMDLWGADKCEANIDTIVGWLRAEAVRRGLPFVDAGGRMLVRRAIARARKYAAGASSASAKRG